MKSRLFSAFTVLLVLVLTMMLTACFPSPRHRTPDPLPTRHKMPPPPRYHRSELITHETMLALMDTKNMVAALDMSLDMSGFIAHAHPRPYYVAPLLPVIRFFQPIPPRRYEPAPHRRYYRHVPPPPPPRRYTPPVHRPAPHRYAPPPRRHTPPPHRHTPPHHRGEIVHDMIA